VIEVIEGNLFDCQAQTLVNTINCVGVMGKGIALEFKKRYPDMFNQYVDLCNNKSIQIGKLWLYKSEDKWILNFPTKDDWRNPSKIEYLILGLDKFVNTYKDRGITSIAFPLLGASNGGLDPAVSEKIMIEFLRRCDIPVYIYKQ